ncbi:MAG TPA: fasciclin domain-containing protein [Candidatus Limnocylindrales bacterium]|jgi:uncharacterized surface protein with fasciclin (FAS1) repeats
MHRRFIATLATAVLALGIVATPVAARPVAPGSIVDVAIGVNSSGPYAGAFDTLIAAVVASPDVLARLSQRGGYTVFAPTDAAFAKLGLNPSNVGSAFSTKTLTAILSYHVAPGVRDAADVVGSSRIRTLQGGVLRQSGGVLTDALGRTSTIIVTDVPASNGIIHAIDTVVLPFAP